MKPFIFVSALAISLSSTIVIAQSSGSDDRHRNGPPLPPSDLSIEHSLMITDLRVIEDPVRTDPTGPDPGVWTFRYLMEQMAGGHDAAEFVLRWLEQWETEQTINTHQVMARPAMRERVIDPWLAVSGGNRLDLSQAPFKLLAIVNRMDLRDHDGEHVTQAGEGRFVFGVLDATGQPLPPVAGPATGGFLVILEYALLADTMAELERWARDWSELSRWEIGSEDYNQHLERITRDFTDAGRGPGRPNASALNQVRTNEIALAAPWELREFVLDHRSGLLRPHAVALTPDTLAVNGTPEFAALINANQTALFENRFELPSTWFGGSSQSGPFNSATIAALPTRTFTVNPVTETAVDLPWSAAGIADNEARHLFALNTCNGCHRDETDTGFAHVAFPETHAMPVSLGQSAQLSGFLTGIEVVDPVDGITIRRFADLERRAVDLTTLLQSFAENPSRPEARHQPGFVH
ncbi:hypothetical protein [Rhabdochromatium marinum]|uniref:hypothetical protein n=1 Tax=Rhabdochromatium marinum TaxID=48729 RepID=UPI00190392DD|nr:hypothetical protein [Rhabdochromatium marinum]MBK1649048.1 hypothetical protein [Rhabdochromatium marinum]